MNKGTLIAAVIFAAPVFLFWYCGSTAPKASNQDVTCRSLGRDGANAKTQAEYDYAKQKFNEQCANWSDPLQK